MHENPVWECLNMNKKLSAAERFLHWLEMRVIRSTTYSSTPLTFRRFIIHFFRHFIYPFKKRGWFGFCDYCGKFRWKLERQAVDTEFTDDDPDGPMTYAVYGMVCSRCYDELEIIKDEYGFCY